MSVLEGQWIDLFRAGEYSDKGRYTPADLDAMVANYDPAHHEAPVVVGHPETDAPAFGWVAGLRRVGDMLQAKLRQIAPQFEALVREGRFKKRSVAFYRTARGLALRHLGFLGASPPEVKGLTDLQLCEFSDSGTFITVEFQGLRLDTLSNFRVNTAAGVRRVGSWNFNEPTGDSLFVEGREMDQRIRAVVIESKIRRMKPLTYAEAHDIVREEMANVAVEGREMDQRIRAVVIESKKVREKPLTYAEARDFVREEMATAVRGTI
jgi:hypothetical protein